jgi:hypothetical protein
MKRLILADVKSVNNGGGHYLSLAQNYLDLYSNSVKVMIAGGSIYERKIKRENLFLLPYENKSCYGKIKNVFNVLKNCKYLFQNTNEEDVVVVQQSALFTAFLGIVLFACKKNNIYIIAYDTDPISNALKKIVYFFAKKKIKGFVLSSEKSGMAYRKPYCLVPDYIFAGEKIPEDIIPYDKKRYDFIFIGSIWPDKGVVEMAKRFAGTQYKILIAGKPCDENIADSLKNVCKNAANIDLKLGFVKDEDYREYMSEARYSLLNYKGVYAERSSGVVLDVLFAGVPVIGHRTFAMQFIEDEQVGVLFDDIEKLNPSSFMNPDTYENFRRNIAKYLQKQEKYKKDFLNFTNITC